MTAPDALLHNWFYGNYVVRVVAAVGFAALMGTIPVGPLVGWLFAGLSSPVLNRARVAVPALNALKAFVPVAIVAHGGGIGVGAASAAAAYVGHRFSPWLSFRGGTGRAVAAGSLAALGITLLR